MWSVPFQSRWRIFVVLLLAICTKGLKRCEVVQRLIYSLVEEIPRISGMLELAGLGIYTDYPHVFQEEHKNPSPEDFRRDAQPYTTR